MFWNIIWGFVIIALILSGLLNAINWQINIWLIVAVFIIWLITLYNSLIMMRNRVREAWSDIEVQLKRRYDLIPNLVETVKGYMAHESGVFEKVTEARTRAMGAGTKEEKLGAENILSGTLKTLFAVSENYPDLKANANFLDLQRELADTENKIQAARRFYNGNVMDYNTKIEVLPTNLIAKAFNFKKEEFFGIENESERQPVNVKF
ncbi:MAG: LemA family protein [Parcubacteria group bacterium]|nr:LemA family protein [Parcubacteria group bacterium]